MSDTHDTTEQPERTMTRDRFVEATQDADHATIDELVAMLDGAGYWESGFLSAAAQAQKKQHIRYTIKNLKDDSGWPLFSSIKTIDPKTGKEVPVYKQEVMFDPADYDQVIHYHRGRESHHKYMADGYEQRKEERFGQLPMTLAA